MSEIVKEKPIMEEAHKRYNNFIRSRLMMSEYDKKELYQYDKKIMLADERRIGMRQGIKKGKLEGIREGKLEGIREGVEKGKLEGIKEGIKEGMEKGIKERNYTIAKDMKSKNMDIKLISEITGLTIEEISKL